MKKELLKRQNTVKLQIILQNILRTTPVILDENKFEVIHIETDNQKLQFKIHVLTTKITNFEALNTDGSFNDRICEARLARMLLMLDTTSALHLFYCSI